jgi:hypothetical protein
VLVCSCFAIKPWFRNCAVLTPTACACVFLLCNQALVQELCSAVAFPSQLSSVTFSSVKRANHNQQLHAAKGETEDHRASVRDSSRVRYLKDTHVTDGMGCRTIEPVLGQPTLSLQAGSSCTIVKWKAPPSHIATYAERSLVTIPTLHMRNTVRKCQQLLNTPILTSFHSFFF